ncbi:DUF3455 domain-containing protein [Alloacidobacterium dinghuense]|uniref:DUF3455 domain-containing protein n=1 Tax=Alloacidobacterium dinghuense TaxID=2763107 RepID=A0A7G8BG78_9BACT|nr:DUF3455 domain-containing protein [Alloacidobacterium dinghuense]QNI31548.1 DUF3455 domain-containing protein [Alloacidobacterium dinghuense]
MRALILCTALITSAAAFSQQAPSSQASPSQAPSSPAPSTIELPPGTHELLLEAKGEGVQIYTCAQGKWVLKGPDAKLLDAQGAILGSHFAGPTWKLTDGSEVKGKAVASQPSPDADSVPWLLLQAVPGSGSGNFTDVNYIRRTGTRGGVAPKEGCTDGESRQPYTATYSFYSK